MGIREQGVALCGGDPGAAMWPVPGLEGVETRWGLVGDRVWPRSDWGLIAGPLRAGPGFVRGDLKEQGLCGRDLGLLRYCSLLLSNGIPLFGDGFVWKV